MDSATEKKGLRWAVIGGLAGVAGVIVAIIAVLHQMGIIQVGATPMTTNEVSSITTITTETPTTTSESIMTTKPQQSYAVGNIVRFGQYDWLVLDVRDDRVLLITKDIVENQFWNDVEDATWETCTLRAYLNTEFYKKFSAREQAMILTTKNKNPGNPWFKKGIGGNPTDDKVFLLSIEEVATYFGMEEEGREWLEGNSFDPYSTYSVDGNITVGITDIYDYERVAKYNGGAYNWWLRSPGLNPEWVAYVGSKGELRVDGYHIYSTLGDYGFIDSGVRPALWISL